MMKPEVILHNNLGLLAIHILESRRDLSEMTTYEILMAYLNGSLAISLMLTASARLSLFSL